MTSTQVPRRGGVTPAARERAAATRTASTQRDDRTGSVALRLGLVLACLAVMALWWQGTPPASGSTPGGAVTSAGELAGLVAAVLVCTQVLLVARVPWFERAVGLDRLVAWHRSLGTTVVLLVVAHVVLMVTGEALTTRSMLWPAAWEVYLAYPDMFKALLGTVGFLAVAASGTRLVRTRMSYEWWYALHLTTYVSIYLTFGHQVHAGSQLVDSPVARGLWWAMYLSTAASVVVWRLALPTARHVRGLARVQAVVPEADGVTSVWLEGRPVRALQARAGQFVVVRFLAPGHLLSAHPYSLSVVPDGVRVRLTIGALGDHSSRVAALRPGTRVVIEGPYGRFTADRARRHGVLLVAGGAGIGPIRSLAEELWRRGHDVVVVHRVRNDERAALRGELSSAPGLRYVPLVGRRDELGHDPLAPEVLGRIVPDLAGRDVFVCGPMAMCRVIVRSARALGVPRSAIHHDELSF